MNKYNDVNKQKREDIELKTKEFKKSGGRIKTLENGDSADFRKYEEFLSENKKKIIQEQERKAARKIKKAH